MLAILPAFLRRCHPSPRPNGPTIDFRLDQEAGKVETKGHGGLLDAHSAATARRDDEHGIKGHTVRKEKKDERRMKAATPTVTVTVTVTEEHETSSLSLFRPLSQAFRSKAIRRSFPHFLIYISVPSALRR
ncbi:MAG: hypothetical protein FRX48_02439 [Lasallia pustulata]|uniref:Uncharacterized protein n=1 Tax=Lasallia pustulata TaxID=136370 RepID=A0A5M8PWT2_9LECA|nr:MAG: hypothetical protein FRX48_02439 [Lasallia pustulata]